MYKHLELRAAVSKWQNEVDAETIKLVEAGMPPHSAAIQAVKTIANKWSTKHADKSRG